MIMVRRAMVDGIAYGVTISDEEEALSAAYAAGGAVLGLWDGRLTGGRWLCEYVVESLEDVDEELLGRVVRRRFKLPWLIGETERLLIREFTPEDAVTMLREELSPEDGIFYNRETLERYIHSQYRFFEYGIWALVQKESRTIIGRAGLSKSGWEWKEEGQDAPLELGYHVFLPWRRRGYGEEACREIMDYASRRITGCLHAVADGENEASRRLAKALGFRLTAERCNGLTGKQYLYVWNCPG